MYWVVGGLFVFGAACGAVIGLTLFIGVLIGVALVTMIATVAYGIGIGLLNALLAVAVLQIGYAAGLILRAAIQKFGQTPRFGHCEYSVEIPNVCYAQFTNNYMEVKIFQLTWRSLIWTMS